MRRLIAIMLGTLKMDVDTCIDKYLELAPSIFPKEGFISRSKIVKVFKGATGLARFNPKPLEDAVKELAEAKFPEFDPWTPFDALKADAEHTSGKVQVMSWRFVGRCLAEIITDLSARPIKTRAQAFDSETIPALGNLAQNVLFGRP